MLVFGLCLFALRQEARGATFRHADTQRACPAMASFAQPGLTMRTLSASIKPAGSESHTAATLPEHCAWQAEINPRTGVDGKHYGIGFELRMPVDWNGKFFFQGGGGMDGLIRPAIGAMPNGSSTAAVALARGYAVASTDAGHEGSDGSFGADPQARLDYYSNAIEMVTQVSRKALAQYYGAAPVRSYFVGCSNGGRQALIAAQRFPLLFDGVVAGDPAFNLTHAAVAELWDDRTFLRIAPKDSEGQPVLSRAFSDEDLKLLGASVLARCDALDGAQDGLIEAPQRCHYDPAVLTCKGEKTESCLSREQVGALKTAFAGPTTSAGRPLYSDWPYDTGIAARDWRSWKLGTSLTAQSNALNMTLGPEATRSLHRDVYEPSIDIQGFDFDHAVEASNKTTPLEDANTTAMEPFADRGGKLILFTGMSDPIFSANDLIRYFQRLQADNHGEASTARWAKLYLIPGMTHCGGGPALDDFDPLQALDDWVEKRTVPVSLPAQGKQFPGRTRNLCAFPEYPHYNGSGSIDAAAGFSCKRDAQ